MIELAKRLKILFFFTHFSNIMEHLKMYRPWVNQGLIDKYTLWDTINSDLQCNLKLYLLPWRWDLQIGQRLLLYTSQVFHHWAYADSWEFDIDKISFYRDSSHARSHYINENFIKFLTTMIYLLQLLIQFEYYWISSQILTLKSP